MTLIKKIILLFFTSLMLLSCDNSIPKKEVKILRIGTPSGSGRLSGILGLSVKLGYLKEELDKIGFDFKISGFPGAGPAVNEALVNKSIDMAVYADLPGLIIKSKGVDVSLWFVEDTELHAGVAVLKARGIQSLADLVGKKVSLPKGTYMQRYFNLLVQHQGYSLDDFTVIQMTSDAESALINQSIDAMVWTQESIEILRAKEPNVTYLDSTVDNIKWAGQSIVIGDNGFIRKNPEVFGAIRRAMYKARDYARKNPEHAEKLLSEVLQTDVKVIKILNNFHEEDKMIQKYPIDVNAKSIEKLERTQEFMLQEQLTNHKVDIKNWVYQP